MKAIAPESLGHIYQLPRAETWEKPRLPTRGGKLMLQPWVCVNADRPLVVHYRLLRDVLRAARRRQPAVIITDRYVEVRYARGYVRLLLHDATYVLGKLHHHYMNEQRALAARLHKIAPLDSNERTA